MLRLRGLAPGVALGLLLIDLVGMVVLSVARPQFLSTYNLFVTGRDLSILLLVALAQMIVLSLGQMNLSIGSIGGLVAIIESGLMVRYGVPVLVALAAGLLLGIVCGVVNGLLVYWTKINSFVLTLGTSYVFAGINLGVTHATPFYHIPGEISSFGQARVGPFPVMAVVTIVLTLLLAAFLSQVVLGRQLLAVGGNPLAARLSGLPIRRATLTAHAISGFFAAVAGTMLMAQLGQGQPTIGATWVLPSFAGPIIGGAALSGGTAPILGTVLAMVLISLIDDGLVLVSADPFWVQFLIGALILGAVVLGRTRLSEIRALLRISPSNARSVRSSL
ncbi:MAG TPA: ABC transporter permease [Candidatus Eisenbacteria bacterium]|nr:ABC transporter permease [Candidatus Eisenbacteria bacterium]